MTTTHKSMDQLMFDAKVLDVVLTADNIERNHELFYKTGDTVVGAQLEALAKHYHDITGTHYTVQHNTAYNT